MRCFLALGGNVGDVAATLRAAWEQLAQVPGISALEFSALYRTPAVGDDAGGDFVNAAGSIETLLEPLALLDVLQRVESELGRTRSIVWGPRTLDLDLVFYGDRIVRNQRLTAPHPACWYRRFVLDPLADIGAGVIHPEHRVTIGALRERLLPRPLPVTLVGDPAAWEPAWDRLSSCICDVRLAELGDTNSEGLRLQLAADSAVEFPRPPFTVDVPAGTPDNRATFVKYVLEAAVSSPVRMPS